MGGVTLNAPDYCIQHLTVDEGLARKLSDLHVGEDRACFVGQDTVNPELVAHRSPHPFLIAATSDQHRRSTRPTPHLWEMSLACTD